MSSESQTTTTNTNTTNIHTTKKEEIRALFNLWNDTLKTLNPEKVADRYTTNAILLPNVSKKLSYNTTS